jgi:hypothetical protein
MKKLAILLCLFVPSIATGRGFDLDCSAMFMCTPAANHNPNVLTREQKSLSDPLGLNSRIVIDRRIKAGSYRPPNRGTCGRSCRTTLFRDFLRPR